MVNWKRLATQAKDVYEKADKDDLKRKAEGLKDVAQGKGSLSDKAKAAADVVTSKEDEAEEASEKDEAAPSPDATEKAKKPAKSRAKGKAGKGAGTGKKPKAGPN